MYIKTSGGTFLLTQDNAISVGNAKPSAMEIPIIAVINTHSSSI